jgi:hypothetical protein
MCYSQCCGAMSIQYLTAKFMPSHVLLLYCLPTLRKFSALWNRGHKLCQPRRAIVCSTRRKKIRPSIPFAPPDLTTLILRDSLDQALDRTQPASAFALAMPHAPSSRADFLVHNLHRDYHAAKLSHVLQQDSSFHLMTGHASLHIIRYKEPKLCEFGRAIHIRSGPHGMAKV